MIIRHDFSFRRYGKNWYGGNHTDLDYITGDLSKYVVGLHQNFFFTLPEEFDLESLHSITSDTDESVPTYCTIRYQNGKEVTLRNPEKFDRFETTSWFSEGKEIKTISKLDL